MNSFPVQHVSINCSCCSVVPVFFDRRQKKREGDMCKIYLHTLEIIVENRQLMAPAAKIVCRHKSSSSTHYTLPFFLQLSLLRFLEV